MNLKDMIGNLTLYNGNYILPHLLKIHEYSVRNAWVCERVTSVFLVIYPGFPLVENSNADSSLDI